jgi:alkylhydroperoxidase family enzyme
LQHGATEDLISQVDCFETSDLSEAQKVVLRFADVFLSSPAELTDELRESVRSHFTSAQIVELVFRLIGWTRNKPMVALGLELDEVRHQLY